MNIYTLYNFSSIIKIYFVGTWLKTLLERKFDVTTEFQSLNKQPTSIIQNSGAHVKNLEEQEFISNDKSKDHHLTYMFWYHMLTYLTIPFFSILFFNIRILLYYKQYK